MQRSALYILFFCLLFTGAGILSGCKRSDPIYEYKPEVGDADVKQWDMMEDQPKYIKVRRSEREKMLIAEERKKRRMKDRSVYQGAYGFDE